MTNTKQTTKALFTVAAKAFEEDGNIYTAFELISAHIKERYGDTISAEYEKSTKDLLWREEYKIKARKCSFNYK